ncbi:MAG: (d)CMP kinase [Gemmatimonadota bacterium]|nr:(d)CMP kinase [Gemmatimonadota bacterium]
MRRPIVAIDGPAGSGKSTTAALVARRLGYAHLNSGLLYRAIAWTALRDGWADDAERFPRELGRLRLDLEPRPPAFVVRVNGEACGPALLQAPATARRASAVATREDVREAVLRALRDAGREGAIVCDGRDIGTVVFPEAEVKVFLVADAEERARRRVLDHGGDPTPDTLSRELEELRRRDERDSGRSLAPLRAAEDAVELDTTSLSPDEVVDRIAVMARDAGAGPPLG